MKMNKVVKLGLGIGITSAVVGVVVYNVAKAKKPKTYTEKVLNKLEDTMDNVTCLIKK